MLVSAVTQTDLAPLESPTGEERRRGKAHRRQPSTTVPRGQVAGLHRAAGPAVPNCERGRQSRLLSGIASYGQLDRLLGRSCENIYSASGQQAAGVARHKPRVPQFARTHSTLV